MVHYYTDNQDLASEKRTISFQYAGKTIVFTSDRGVFSKDTVDYGSRVLLSTFPPLQHIHLLDVGCGYGPIALSLCLAGEAVSADMVDVNTRALQLAKENAQKLQLSSVRIFESSCYEHVTDTYDLIVSNPPIRAGKAIVHEILSGAYDHLKPHGELRIVIQKKQGAPSAQKKMLEVFGNCQILKRDKGYYILQSLKK